MVKGNREEQNRDASSIFKVHLCRKQRHHQKRYETCQTLKSIWNMYLRARSWRKERTTEAAGEKGKQQLLHFQVQEWRFDKHLGFLLSKNLWKALIQAGTERGIRLRHTEKKYTNIPLHILCIYLSECCKKKLLLHWKHANVLNFKGLRAVCENEEHWSGSVFAKGKIAALLYH